MEGGRGEGEKGRETDTVYPLRSSAASMPRTREKFATETMAASGKRNTTGTSCILAPIKRVEEETEPEIEI